MKKRIGNLLEPLVLLVKDKIGPVRKSAAILLAKLCQDPDILKEARKMHATDVLVNLSQVLLESN